MAGSRTSCPLGRDPFGPSPLTPGPLGRNDAASPGVLLDFLGNTPGPLGYNDHASPWAIGSLLGGDLLHVPLSLNLGSSPWDYDPGCLLNDSNLNPKFVAAARRALTSAVGIGLRPRVHEAYRSPQESDSKHKLWKQGKGGRAAAGWRSCHNYGLAMDVYLYDSKGKQTDNHVKGWYKEYKLMATAASELVWGEGFGSGDADHWEYHPNWPKGADGSLLLKVKAWAIQAAQSNAGVPPGGPVKHVPEPNADKWMPYFWWAAGAGETEPPTAFLAKNPPPSQPAPAKKKKAK
jgi:hypothetical protein